MSDDERKQAPRCEALHCRNYIGGGHYARGFGYTQVNDRQGAPRWLCQACYLRWADTADISVAAKLLHDPDSIPSQALRANAEWQRQQDDENAYRHRRDHEG